MKVGNHKIIRKISFRSMQSAKGRNVIAILAIALTTLLFTALFTIAMTINDAMQDANFREVGGFAHGSFKYLSLEQVKALKGDELIKRSGQKMVVGSLDQAPFNKSYFEVDYMDKKDAALSYTVPDHGRLPQEGTQEVALDDAVLKILNVKPKLGRKISLPVNENNQQVTEEFTLSGWWAHDPSASFSQVLIPKSRAERMVATMGELPEGSGIGTWSLDVMFANSRNIKQNMLEVLANQGYQNKSRMKKHYIQFGVNWAYTGAKLDNNSNTMMYLAIAAILLVIMLTGYLIIYNVFQISVTNDIRFYGLMKTIGTTGRQIKRMIRQQALVLSTVGIPLGTLLGYLLGAKLTPFIMNTMSDITVEQAAAHPLIFLGAIGFALITVLISCHKPGRIAAKVAPAEAVHYTEKIRAAKKLRKAKKGASLAKMAWANVWRSPAKTVVTVVSLALAVVLMNMTATFTKGFDMKKAMRNMPEDFIFSDATYFSSATDTVLTPDAIDKVNSQKEVADGGSTYVSLNPVQEFVPEKTYRDNWKDWYSKKQLQAIINSLDHDAKRNVLSDAQVEGMERYGLDKCEVLGGDISKLHRPGKYVAAVYSRDDYNKLQKDSHWAKVGDKVTLRYLDKYEYYNPFNGKIVKEDSGDAQTRGIQYREVTYEVAALVVCPDSMGGGGFYPIIMNADELQQDSGASGIEYYAFDTGKKNLKKMDHFMKDYTENQATQLGYQSKITKLKGWESQRNMFLMVGAIVSFIIGLVGILNFLNAVLTGILSRRREFAVEQSVGMTGKQLKRMLIFEGLFYALGAILISTLLSVVTEPLVSSVLGSTFWFFTYRFTIWPVLVVAPIFILLGVLLPLVSYRSVAKRSIVERLREAEG